MPIHAKTVFSAFGIAGIILLLLPSSARGALSVFQAETGVLTGVSIATRNFGFESAGYADYNDRGGGSIAWTYNAASSGDVKVTIRYATMNDRPLDLYIDGTKRAEFLCKNTGSWTSWTNEMAMLSLEGGAHTLLLQARLTGPNVDWLSVLSSEPEPNESPQTDIRSPAVVYQAETALLTKVTLETVNAGYDGSGYADYQGIGGFLLWSVTAPSTARYDVKAKYATVNERKCNLYIDNALVGTFSFRGTGAWNKWNEETIVVSLTQGVHQLKILAEDSSGPNIDRISVASSCGIECDFAPPPTPRDVPITPPPNIFAIPRIFSSRVVLASNQGLERGQFVSSRKSLSFSKMIVVMLVSYMLCVPLQRTENLTSA